MKRKYLSIALLLSSAFLFSCNSDGDHTASGDTTALTIDTPTTTDNSATAMPLQGEDNTFAMDAALGGMMEVESSTIAQENATNQRVKDFADMIVRDHTTANNELKMLASSKNTMLPDSLTQEQKNHLDAMRKMKGKAFDKHYIDMMVNDHKETISKFEKASSSATDADLKAWAGKTLPVLQMHKDSADAIKKMKM